MTITEIDRGALRCEEAGRISLGFPTGLNPRRFSGADTVSLRNSPGLIISVDGRVEEWIIEKFIDHDGQIVALGPWIEGTKPFGDESFGPSTLNSLIRAARALSGDEYPLEGLYLRALRHIPDGGTLVYPPRLAAWVRESCPEEELRLESELWVHPDLSGGESWVFSLGMVAWRILADADPCAGETGEPRRERLRLNVLPPIESRIGNIDPEAANIINRSLIPELGRRPTLEDWEGLMRQWTDRGLTVEIDAQEEENRRNRAIMKYEGREKRLKARQWFRKSGWKLITITTAIILSAAVLSAPVRKALKPPATEDMSRIQVAQTYYEAIDSLNSELMDDCLAKGTGKADKQQVDMVYVTHKVRQGYEGLGELPRAGDWIRDGKPELPKGFGHGALPISF